MKINYTAPIEIKEKYQIKNDNLIKQLATKTPQQVADWIDTNVNNLADAKTVLKVLAKVVTYLVRHNKF